MSVCQKLGVILESKVVQKLTLEKKFLLKNGLLNRYSLKNSFEYVDSWPKLLLFRTHHLWNSTTELILMLILLWICSWCQGSRELPQSICILQQQSSSYPVKISRWFLMWLKHILEEFRLEKRIFFIKDELHSSSPCWVILRSLHLFDYDKHIPWLLWLSIGITVVWTNRIECWYSYEYALDVSVPGNFLRAFVYSDSKAECNPISRQSKLLFVLQPPFHVRLKQMGFNLCECRKYHFW